MTVRDIARSAYVLAQEQLALLEQGSFEDFEPGFTRLEDACTTLLRTPLAEFDDETAALSTQLVQLQRAICAQLDVLLAEAGEAVSANKRGRTVLHAYRPETAQLRAPRAV